MSTLRRSEDQAVTNTLLSSYCPPAIKEARERQDAILTKRFQGRRLAIADLGCGDGYHGSLFGPSCTAYHGFEIVPELASMTRERWRREGLDHAEVFEGDVADVPLRRAYYDLVFCLYFTPGNFREKSADLSIYTDEYLDRNPGFIDIFSRFHDALKPGGSMFLTVYKDVPEAEAAQMDFYDHTGQHVVTPPGSRFVATAENFWSARWTRASMLSNLGAFGVAPENVAFHDLNEIAWLVEITQ